LLGIAKLHKEKNQFIREKTGTQNDVNGIKRYQKKWLQHVERVERNRNSGYNMYRGWREIGTVATYTEGGEK
jgi:hypothetical protein